MHLSRFPLLLVPVVLAPLCLQAAKVIDVRPVDREILQIHIKDAEVFYRDDGTGPSAFTGHDYSQGDDRLERYGEKLDVARASRPEAWSLETADGRRLTPSAVHRKAKVQGTTEKWEYALDHWVFLRLPEPLTDGQTYTLHTEASTQVDRLTTAFRYDQNQSVSEAIHVNLLGYTPDSPVKAADLYLWLGDGGARDYSSFEGRSVWLYDTVTGQRHDAGQVKFGRKNGPDVEQRNMTGSDVWHVDFTTFKRPGTYRLVVDGVGASPSFEIRPDVWRTSFRTSLLGYYYMRIGEPKDARVPAPRQPQFIGDVNPVGLQIYKTDLDPMDDEWRKISHDTWDEPHFKKAVDSVFMTRRLPGNPTQQGAKGGHSDALDWDRHLGHVGDIYDLLLPYLLSGGKLKDDGAGIRESGNGIPDLIDEARNEVDFWLSARDGEAYSHGLTNPTREKTVMFQAGCSAMAAWANAANCAMIAEAFRLADQPELMGYYRDEAVKAWRFAEKQADPMLDRTQEIGDSFMRGRDFRQMAAAFLYNVTGEAAWEKITREESVVKDAVVEIEKKNTWNQLYASAAYLTTPRAQPSADFVRLLRASVREQALQNNVRWMDQRPSRRSSNNNHWQTAQNLQLVMLAHRSSSDAAEQTRFEQAMILEADWGLGRNPMNRVEMTGLGSRSIENCYTSGRNDGTPGLHPGHTPYNNLDPWGKDNGSNPHWFTDRGYPAWAQGWPHQEAYFNSRYCWSNGEFTPRQTMRGKMALLGYLEFLSLTRQP